MFVPTAVCPNPPAEQPASFGFGQAIAHMNAGGKVARAGWNGKGMWIAKQVPDAGSKMTLPYAFMMTADGALVPWLASQTDIFALDWVEVA